MNKTIIDILMIIIICIFILGHAFIISLLIVNAIEKHKKKKQKEIKCKNKYSGYYKIMAPKLDSIDKACYNSTPELYYIYGIGMDFKHIMARFKRGTTFNLLPSAKCYFVEMTQDEYTRLIESLTNIGYDEEKFVQEKKFGTPLTLIIKNGKVSKYIAGERSKSQLVREFRKEGLLTE